MQVSGMDLPTSHFCRGQGLKETPPLPPHAFRIFLGLYSAEELRKGQQQAGGLGGFLGQLLGP